MKLIPSLVLGLSAVVLGTIAVRTADPTYVPPKPEVEAATYVPSVPSGKVPADHVAVTLGVDGMCCNGCTKKLYERLREVEGVLEAAVDFESAAVRAVVPNEVNVDRLSETLTFDEYTAVARPVEADF
ncbi:MAG: heavy-metal-associated domain-containing protein [bacterium]|nr:heavy-metal-associated domain-containing protein [bacterium]